MRKLCLIKEQMNNPAVYFLRGEPIIRRINLEH